MRGREFTISDEYRYDYGSVKRWIASHVLRYPWLPLGSLLGYIGSSACFSLTALLIGRAFDTALTTSQLIGLVLGILAARTVQGLLSLGGTFAIDTLGQRLERDARDELYLSLLSKSQTFHNRQRTGDIMARATNDVQQLNAMLNPGIRLISEASLNALITLIAIAVLRVELLLVPLLFMLSFGITLWHYSKRLMPVASAQRWQFGKLNSGLAEAISGIEVVKAYAQESQALRRFMTHAERARDLSIQQGKVQAFYLPLLIYSITFGLAFGHALAWLMSGVLQIGEVIAFMGLMTQLRFLPMISLFSFSLVQFGVAGAQRVLGLILSESELDENIAGEARRIQGEICFDQVTFGYTDAPILKDLSFHARPGATIAIVGQTGAGKSTLTRLVNRTYDVSTGSVLIDGVDVKEWSLQSLRSQISTIEQDVFLFSRTIAENIAFGAAEHATQAQIEQAAREAQAHDFIVDLPEGYNTVIGERGMTLSGGQRQRIALARAVLTNPRILILDDSTSAIDSATEDQIQRAMRRVMQGRTTLLITQRISQIRWADHILVLRNGQLVAQGSHAELLKQSAAYRHMFARYERSGEQLALAQLVTNG